MSMVFDLDHPDDHPIVIAVSENEAMGAFDLQISVGNFKTKADAVTYADAVQAFMQRETGGRGARFVARA